MSSNTRILVVEDSPTQAMRLRYFLEKEGYLVSIANNGLDALSSIQTARPALVISDIIMPEMDGYELCQRIKSDSSTSDIPVILLTHLSETEDVFRALKVGADNFITKPYEERSLLESLQRILKNLDLRRSSQGNDLEVFFEGEKHSLSAPRAQVVDFLLSTYESALLRNRELNALNVRLQSALEDIKVLQANYRQLLETNADAVVVVDRTGIVRYANPAANALLASNTGQLQGDLLSFDVTPGERREMELATRSGEPAVAELQVVESVWDKRPVHLAVLRDITEHVKMREELRRLSLWDQLTSLYNRRGFCVTGEQMLAASSRAGSKVFLLFLDLDGMKQINDTLGHQQGDAALVAMAQLLESSFRKTDIIGRLGGDEFAVLGIENEGENLKALQERLISNIQERNAQPGLCFELSASTGFVHYTPTGPSDLNSLMERADAAMYEQKRSKQRLRRAHVAERACL